MTIMAERTDIGPTVAENQPGGLQAQRSAASALFGLLRMDELPTVSWTVFDRHELGERLDGQISRTWYEDREVHDDQALMLQALQRWADFWHRPIEFMHPHAARVDAATLQVVFEYRGVQVTVWTTLTDPELIRPLLRAARQ